MTPEQLKAFCEAWQIAPKTHRHVVTQNGIPLVGFVCREDAEELAGHFPDHSVKEDAIYPPLTLELLLGVLDRDEIFLNFSTHHVIESAGTKTRYDTEIFDNKFECVGSAFNPVDCLFLTMAKFKGI